MISVLLTVCLANTTLLEKESTWLSKLVSADKPAGDFLKGLAQSREFRERIDKNVKADTPAVDLLKGIGGQGQPFQVASNAKLGQGPVSKAYQGGGGGAAIAQRFTADPQTVRLAQNAYATAKKEIQARPENFAGPSFSHVFVEKFAEELAKTEGLTLDP